MAMGAYKDTFQIFYRLKHMECPRFSSSDCFIKCLLRKEKRIKKKWILNLFLMAGFILLVAIFLAVPDTFLFFLDW